MRVSPERRRAAGDSAAFQPLDQALQPRAARKSGEQFFDAWISQDGCTCYIFALEYQRPSRRNGPGILPNRSGIPGRCRSSGMSCRRRRRFRKRDPDAAVWIPAGSGLPRPADGFGEPRISAVPSCLPETHAPPLPTTDRITEIATRRTEYPAENRQNIKNGAPAVIKRSAPVNNRRANSYLPFLWFRRRRVRVFVIDRYTAAKCGNQLLRRVAH